MIESQNTTGYTSTPRMARERSARPTGDTHSANKQSRPQAAAPHVHRPATRKPDLSHPAPHSVKPSVVIGGVPRVTEKPKKRLFAAPDAPRVRTIRAQKHVPFPYAMLFMLLLCTGLFMYMVHNFVEINEYSMELRNMNSRLDELISHQQHLELELENRNDLSVIADIAEKDLGMVKMDEVEKHYLDGSGKDKVEISKSPEEESTEINVLSTLLNAIARNFRDFAEYID